MFMIWKYDSVENKNQVEETKVQYCRKRKSKLIFYKSKLKW